MQEKVNENKTMHINDYFWPKYGANLKKRLDKHEANSIYIIRYQSISTLLNHSRNGKKIG